MEIRFIGDGYGFQQYCKQHLTEYKKSEIKIREKQVKNLYNEYPHQPWGNKIDDFDILIHSLVKFLWSLNIETIASCQGNIDRSPYVYFYIKDLNKLNELHQYLQSWHIKINEGWFWNNYILNYCGTRNNKYTFMLQFYDIIAVHYFLYSINFEYNKNIDFRIGSWNW